MSSPFSLLGTRRFAPLFSCMALSAFNDNFYKNALIILITYALADEMHITIATFISMAAAMFILPFFIFSGVAGLMADRFPKHVLVRILKATELALFVFAVLALYMHNAYFLLAMLFMLGVQASFFGPLKYAMLPELLSHDELLGANGLTEAGTFLSILTGTLLGGLLVMAPNGVEIVAAVMIAIGVLGVVASRYVPETKALNPTVKISYNIFTTTWDMVRHAFTKPALLVAIVAISWFWAIGTIYLTNLPVFTKLIVGGDEQIVTLYSGLFSIGIGIGSLACHSLLKGRVSLKFAPWALLIIAAVGVDLFFLENSMPTPHGPLIGIKDYFTIFSHYRIVLDLLVISIAGGIFIVPLYTTLQVESDPNSRARTIASNNVINALFVAVGSAAAAGLYATGLNVEHVLLIFSLMSLPLIAWLYRYNR